MDLLYNFPIKGIRPIKEMPINTKWSFSYRNGLIIENSPPNRRIFVNYTLVSEYKIGDSESERIAIVYIILNGFTQKLMARIWGLHPNSINNYMAAYWKLGFKGVTDLYYEPEKRRSSLDDEAVSFDSEEAFEQISCFDNLDSAINPDDAGESTSSFSNEEEITLQEAEIDSETIVQDSIEAETHTCYGGNMLFYPFINELYSSILDKADTISDNDANCFDKIFRLREIILTFMLYVFMGIPNIEQGKILKRSELGVLIGKRQFPCCKTMRTGLNMLTCDNFPDYFNHELTLKYVKLRYVKLGTIYIDGHFVPYYGKTKVHKGYRTQRRLAMPGHYQNWVNDATGRPIFFYIDNSNVLFKEAILKAAKDILALMNESEINDPLILVFDRGAYDGKLFSELDKLHVGFITWKKGNYTCDKKLLTDILSYENRDGETVSYKSYKDKIKINNYRSDVEALAIYDEKTDKLSCLINNLEYVGICKTDSEKIQLLDGRWKHENFFKEAKVREDIDHQSGYDFEMEKPAVDDPETFVANPKYLRIKEQVEKLKEQYETKNLKRENILKKYEETTTKKTLTEYINQKGNIKIIEEFEKCKKAYQEKKDELSKVPSTVKYRELHPEDIYLIKTERSAILLGIRASVYNMRKRLEDLAAECFKDKRELSKFVVAITSTDATVIEHGDTVTVKLNKLETPVYQRSAEKLIHKLNEKGPTMIDGTGRKINFQF